MSNNYTGREIAIFTDLHGLYYPLKAVLEDIKKRNITEIYSLGDNIGVGPNPKEVLDLLEKYNVKSINGNNEEYSILGIEPFKVYFDSKDYKNALIYFTKGMQVMMNVFGEDHPNTQTLLHSMDNTFQAVIRENPGEPQWQQIYEGFKYSHKLK